MGFPRSAGGKQRLAESGVRRFVIVGNGAAGSTCAEVLKKQEPSCEVTLITNEPYPLYNRVTLPRMLKNEVPAAKVFLKTVEWHAETGIRFRPGTRVTAIDAGGRTVLTDRGEEIPWDALLIATGGRPNPLPAAEGGAANCLNFQYYDDTVALSAQIAESRRAVAIGGSFIAYELAEAFRVRGLEVAWLIRGPRWLRRILDDEGGRLVDQIAAEHGVEVLHGQEVDRLVMRDGAVTGVHTTGGQTLDCQLVGVGLGLTMNAEFVRDAGVQTRKGVLTDSCLRTNVPGIFAAGDIAEYADDVWGGHHLMGTWDNALAHGRVAALNMLGANQPYVDVPTYQSGLFDTIISVLGVTPETLPDAHSVTRSDPTGKTYRKLFFQGDRLVAAVMIGSIKGKKKMMEMIRQGAELKTEGEKQALLG